MAQSLDQQRAKFAWKQAGIGVNEPGYVNLVKGASAFIMNNGLMQALAFYKSRSCSNSKAAQLLLDDLLQWIAKVHKIPLPVDFSSTMPVLFEATSLDHIRITQEVLSMLRWLRQFADALKKNDATS